MASEELSPIENMRTQMDRAQEHAEVDEKSSSG
jgi:hypothetical protein